MIFLIVMAVLLPAAAGLFIKKHGILTAVLAVEIAVNAGIALCAEKTAVLWKMTDGLAFMVGADGLSRLFGIVISVIWLLACVYAFGYMEREHEKERFFKFFMLTEAALMLIVYSGNFLTFFVGFEAMTVLSMPMVIHEQDAAARSAAMKYLGFSIFGAAAALAGFFVLDRYCANTVFTPGGVLDMAKAAGHENMLRTMWLVMVIGFGAKAGMFPLHSWLPTAHPVAPSPASAVLSGVITKCGVLAIIRVTYYLFGVEFLAGTWAQTAAIVLALITVFMGSMMALKQQVIKKRLAYSTVSQVSYVIFGLMLMSEKGFQGAMLQAVFHMLAKNALFMWAGAVIHETGRSRVEDLGGMGRKMPAAMWGFTIASLSLIGIPPTGGFVSKWYLAAGALGFENYAAGFIGVCVLIISALLTAGYLLPVMAAAFFPGREAYFTPVEKHEPSGKMLAPILLLAIMTVVTGIFPNLITDAIEPVVRALF